MSDWSAKNPFLSTSTHNFILNGDGSRKETRHIVFDLGDSGMTYTVSYTHLTLPTNREV